MTTTPNSNSRSGEPGSTSGANRSGAHNSNVRSRYADYGRSASKQTSRQSQRSHDDDEVPHGRLASAAGYHQDTFNQAASRQRGADGLVAKSDAEPAPRCKGYASLDTASDTRASRADATPRYRYAQRVSEPEREDAGQRSPYERPSSENADAYDVQPFDADEGVYDAQPERRERYSDRFSSGYPPRFSSRSSRTRQAEEESKPRQLFNTVMQMLTGIRLKGIPLWVIVALVLFVLVIVGALRCSGPVSSNSGVLEAAWTNAQAAYDQSEASYEGVDDPWYADGEKFTTGDRQLDYYVKTYCDNETRDDNVQDRAFNTFTDVVWQEYVVRDNNQDPQGPDWTIEYAKQFYETNSGNCYEFAAFVSYVLQYYGYRDAKAEPCIVEMESGSWEDHALVFVTDLDGVYCVCDSSLGSDGWMVEESAYSYKIVDVGQNG